MGGNKTVSQGLTYLESVLGFDLLDLLTGILLYLCLGGFRGFLGGFEAFSGRVMLLRELHNRNVS